MGWFHKVTDACLYQKYAQCVLDKTVAELEPRRSRLPGAEEGVILKDIYGVMATGTGGPLRGHLHAQAVSEYRAIVEAVKGLLEAGDRHGQ